MRCLINENKKKHKIGDIVFPIIGPHKHKPHEIILCLENGTFNIKPTNIKPSKIVYKLGAVNCSPIYFKK